MANTNMTIFGCFGSKTPQSCGTQKFLYPIMEVLAHQGVSSFQFFGVRFWHLYFLLSYSIYKTEKIRKKEFLKSDLLFLPFYFTKDSAPKYKGIIGIFVFQIFRNILFLWNDSKSLRSFCLIYTLPLIPILPYFMTFYVICHMA